MKAATPRSWLLGPILFAAVLTFVLHAAIAGDWQVVPQFECGTYRVAGVLGKNSQGDFVLTMRKGSSSPFELLVLGGDLTEKNTRTETSAVLEVYVPKPIKSNQHPFVFLQGFSKEPLPKGVERKLLKAEKCGEMGRFK